MFGVLNIHKPVGCTSRDVVNRVQRLVKPVKVGHAGTLDPLASGVLLVCLGPATRLMESTQRYPKSYRGTFLLGRQSETDDLEGEVIEFPDSPVPAKEVIEAACTRFTGKIMQRPPVYSAVKIEGRPSYKLARRGEAVELAEKPITIYSLDIVEYEYPELTLDITCSSGTYIRSLGRDLAASLGTVALMSSLVRTEIGPFQLIDALPMYAVTLESIAKHLQSPLRLLDSLPIVLLTEEEVTTICRGRPVQYEVAAGEVAAIDQAGDLVAILFSDGSRTLRPKRVFLSERCN